MSYQRPKIQYGAVAYPNPKEGSDGDIQIRSTNLGAKLFGKTGGRWYVSPLTSTEGTPITRMGTSLENHLAISPDRLEFMKDSVSMLSITNTGDINMTGKIIITSIGTANVCIGTGNVDLGTNNISIGVDAGKVIEAAATDNVCIGTEAGKALTEGQSNTFVGVEAGLDVVTGDDNTIIGHEAIASRSTPASATNRTVIGKGAEGVANNTCTIGNTATTDFYLNENIHAGTIAVDTNVHLGTVNVYCGNAAVKDSEIHWWQVNTDTSALRSAWKAACDNNNGPNWYLSDTIGAVTRLRVNFATGAVEPGANKTQDLGISGTAWDDCYADDFHNEADFYNFDEYDDLATLHQIKGSGNRQDHNGYEIIDDSTLPDWLVSKHKKYQKAKPAIEATDVRDAEDAEDEINIGDKILSPDGNPFLSLKTMISLLMGAVRQLDTKNIEEAKELSAKLDTMQTEINNLKSE